ncbi:hypothetical protein GCM10010833_11140 [Blastomonas aquatica]|uniref:Uncharacterized protein n=1 Tax=Blastomonas aquatica TaxID=1510276 RepID=A0ABQ1J5U4_9SPHN|nr:hypothetical protein GCM10010833_11140 [Blastomonas aquatica]
MARQTVPIKFCPDQVALAPALCKNAQNAGGRNLADRRAHGPAKRFQRLDWVPSHNRVCKAGQAISATIGRLQPLP